MIPQELQDVARAIKQGSVQLPSGSGDARRDSAMAENAVTAFLQNQNRWTINSPDIGSAHSRSWYDLNVNGFYCDVKISELRGNDNTNAAKAVYYLLTGKDPAEVPSQQKPFFKSMCKNESADEARDFYFIVVKKPAAEDAFVVSLKSIAKLTPAPGNLPFQCKWDNCRIPEPRTWTQAREFLLAHWAESIKKRIATAQQGMPEYYPDFFE